jgi:hypothetical protein
VRPLPRGAQGTRPDRLRLGLRPVLGILGVVARATPRLAPAKGIAHYAWSLGGGERAAHRPSRRPDPEEAFLRRLEVKPGRLPARRLGGNWGRLLRSQGEVKRDPVLERSPASSLTAGVGWSSPLCPACAAGDTSVRASKSTSPWIESRRLVQATCEVTYVYLLPSPRGLGDADPVSDPAARH